MRQVTFMELQHLADFNMGGTKQAGVDHKAESKAVKADGAEQSTPFKDQVEKQIDQAKAESKQDKNDNNQSDSASEEVVSDDAPADSEHQQASQSDTPEQSEDNLNTGPKVDDNHLEDEVIAFNNMLNVTLAPIETSDDGAPLPVSILPEAGKLLPQVASSQVVDQQGVLAKGAPVIQPTVLAQNAATVVTEVDPELVAVDVKAFKSVGVTERPNFLNTQGSMVKSELPVAEIIANASRMQQVPLATSLSNSLSAGQNINVAATAAAVDTGVSMSSAAPLSNSLSTAIGAHVQGSEWPRQMTEQVSIMVKGGLQQAEIKLNPAHLGPLEVRLNVSDDKANISFVTHHAPVRDAIDSAMPRLRDMLEEQGLSLVDVDVSTQSEQQQANDDEQQVQQGLDANVSDADADEVSQGVVSSVEMEIDSGVNLYA